MSGFLKVAIFGFCGWGAALIAQNEAIRRQKRCAGQVQGIDWAWEDPRESGRNLLFSIPWTKNLRTGETERWDMTGRRIA
jgi:hypothetical protein